MSEISNELPIITFNSLYNILREEEKISTLHSLPNHFFEAVDEFISSKKKELKENSNAKTQHQYNSSLKIVDKLQKLRAKKIAILAIESSTSTQDEDELSEKEKEFCKSIRNTYSKLYKQYKN